MVDVAEQAVDVEDGNRCTRVALGYEQLVGCAVIEDAVYQLSIFLYLAARLGDVGWLRSISMAIEE